MSFLSTFFRPSSGVTLETEDLTTDEAKTLTTGGTLGVSELAEHHGINVNDIAETSAAGFSLQDIQQAVEDHVPGAAEDIAKIKEKAAAVADLPEQVKDAVEVAQTAERLAASDSPFAKYFLKLVTCCGGPFAKMFGASPTEQKLVETAVEVQGALQEGTDFLKEKVNSKSLV